MKTSIALVALAGFVSVASAQLADIPPCALSCLTTGVTETECELTDFECSCSNAAFVSSSTACIQTECEAAEREAALAAATALCGSVGIDIAAPPSDAPSGTAEASHVSETVVPSETVEASHVSETVVPSETVEASHVSETVVPSETVEPSHVSTDYPVETSAPSGNSTNGTSPPVHTQDPDSGSSRMAAAMSFVGLGLLAAFAF